METVQQFLSDNPIVFGIFLFLLGLLLFFGAVFDWQWLFGNPVRTNYDFRKIDGLVNFFGRKTVRFIFGTVCLFMMLGGVLVIWMSLKQ
jgi:hypothetical protein